MYHIKGIGGDLCLFENVLNFARGVRVWTHDPQFSKTTTTLMIFGIGLHHDPYKD